MAKYLHLASIISWAIGIIFTVVALFTMNKWISIPMVLFLILGSVLNYVYTRMTYVTATLEEKEDEDSKNNS